MAGYNKRAQAWFADFAIALVIFSIVLISYYTYTTNVSKQDSAVLNDLISDARLISSSILLSGYPDNWDKNTVQIIGITGNNQRIDEDKLVNLKEISFQNAKKLFGTSYDFFLFFEDSNNTLINLGGRCGYGSPDARTDIMLRKTAYYKGEDNLEDEIIEIENELEVTIDKDWQNQDDFLINIKNYDVAVIENPNFNSVTGLETYVSNGGIGFIGKRALSNNGNILGVNFAKRPSCSMGGGNNYLTTVLSKDMFLSLDLGTAFEQNECNYITGDTANVNELAEFDDSTTSIGTWPYGSGIAYYFSDFDTIGYDLQDKVKEAIKGRMIKCGKANSVNVTVSYKNLIKTERLLVYNSKPVKMVLYIWQ